MPEKSDLREKIEHLEEKVESQQSRIEELESQLSREKETADTEEQKVSRRGFLKKLGLGAAGIGALSLAPAASKLTISNSGITKDGGQSFWHEGNLVPSNYLKLDGSNSMTGSLSLNGNDIVDNSTTIWDSSNSYIPSGVVQNLDTHISNSSNPHSVTASEVGSYTTSESDNRYYQPDGDDPFIPEKRTSDPSGVNGRIWYRTDLD